MGRYNVTILVTLVSALVCLGVWLPARSTAGLLVFTLAFGFSSGGFVSLAPACVAQISDMGDVGTRVGAAYAVQALGALTGSPIAGALVAARHGGFLGLQLFCGCCMLASAAVLLYARHLQVGWSITARV